jgi:hypothetical protein
VDRDATERSVAFLHLAKVDTAPNAHTQLLRLVLEAAAGPDRIYGALEGGKEAIARLIDKRTSEGGNNVPGELAVFG